MPYLLISSFLCVIISTANAQINPDRDIQIVLRRNKVGKMCYFNRSKKGVFNKTELTYLGKIKTTDGRVFKILNSIYLWGTSPHATSKIVVYNANNQYIGNYYVGMTYDLPEKIAHSAFVFNNKNRTGCDTIISKKISLRHGLPKQFFLECENKRGDIYYFTSQ